MSIPSYPKVQHLTHRLIGEQLLDGTVMVQEKVDGSQLSWALSDSGSLMVRSRSGPVDGSNGMFELALRSLQERAKLLRPGVVYRGEYLSRPKHNILAYGRVPKGNIALWDVSVGDQYRGPGELRTIAGHLGLECVPTLFYGNSITAEGLRALVDGPSFLGGIREGIVVKNYAKRDEDGKLLCAKLVADAFREVRGQPKKASGAPADIVARAFGTTARWHKALQHLREAGEIEGSVRDIGKLVAEVQRDMAEESLEEMKERLWKVCEKDIMRTTVRGVADWYKDLLMEGDQ